MNALPPDSPTTAVPAKQRRGCLARLVRFTVRALVVLAVVGVVLYLLRGRLLAPLAIEVAERMAGKALHGTMEIEALEGSWFADVTLRGVTFVREGDEGPVELLEEAEAVASYSLVKFLRGEAGWLTEVSMSATNVRLDLTGDAEETAEDPGEQGMITRTLLERPPALDVSIGHLVVRQGTGRVITLEEIDVATPTAGPAPRYEVTAASFGIAGATPEIAPATLRAAVVYDAGKIAVEEVSLGPSFAVREGTLDLRELAHGRLAWGLKLAIGAGTGALTGSLDDARIAADVSMVNVQLSELALFLPPGDQAPPAGLFHLAAHADLPRDPEVEGTVTLDVSGTDVVVAERKFESLALRASLVGDTMRVDEVTARAGENELIGRDLSLSLAAGNALAMLRTATGRLELRLPDVPRLSDPARSAELRETLPPHFVELTASMADGTFTLEAGRIVTAGGEFAVRQGTIVLGEDPERLTEDAVLDVDLKVAFDDLGPLGELLGYDDWGGILRGDLVLRGPLDAPNGELVVTASLATAFGVTVDEAEATVHVTDGHVTAERFHARAGAWEATVSGGYDPSSSTLDNVTARFIVPDLAAVTNERVRGEGIVELSARGPLEAPTGTLQVWASDVEAENMRAIELRLEGTFLGQHLNVEELRIEGPEGTFVATGAAQRDPATGALDVELSTLAAQRGAARLDLEAPVRIAIDGATIAVPPFVLAGELGRAAGRIDHTPERTVADLELTAFDAMPLLEPFLPPGVRTSPIDARFVVELSAERTRIDARLAVDEFVPAAGEPAWRVRTEALLEDSVLRIGEFVAKQDQLGEVLLTGTLPLDPLGEELLPAGALDLDLAAVVTDFTRWPERLRAALQDAEGSARIDARIEGTWAAPRGTIRVEARDLRVRDPGRPRTALGPFTADIDLRLEDSVIHLVSGEVSCPEYGTAILAGDVRAPLDVPALLAEGSDALGDAALDLRATLDVPDLAWAARRLPEVRRIDGRMMGSIALEGTVRTPRLGGEVTLTEGELRLASAFPAMRALEARVVIDGDNYTVERFTGEFGASPFVLTGALDTGGEEPRLTMNLAGTDLLLYRTSDTIVRADVDLDVDGPLSALHAAGELVLTDGRFGRDIDMFSSLQGRAAPPTATRGLDLTVATDPPLSNLTFDVAVRAREPFVLKNNLIQGSLRPDLRLTGTGEVPVLQGRIYLDETRVGLPSGRLLVDSGLVIFGKENPFVPSLELNGKTRIKGYDIRVRVAGDYDDPEFELSSVPPLSNEDLAILFLTGQLPVGSTGERGAGAAQSVAVYVAQDIVKRWFSEGGLDDEESILERVEIEIGADITRSGAATARVVYVLTKNDRRRKRARYLVGERDVYDRINFGYGFRFRFR